MAIKIDDIDTSKSSIYIKIPAGTKYKKFDSYAEYIRGKYTECTSAKDRVVKYPVYPELTRSTSTTRTGKVIPRTELIINSNVYKLDDLDIVDQPAETKEEIKKAKAKKPSLRQLMVKGSVWKFKDDITLELRNHNHGYIFDNGPKVTVAKDTQFIINGKGVTGSWLDKGKGLWIPVKKFLEMPDWVHQKAIKFDEIKDHVEMVSVPDVTYWVVTTDDNETYMPKITGDNDTKILSKAKQYKNYGGLCGGILSLTGYYDGMPDVPYWFEGDKVIEWGDSWRAVEINKFTKEVVKTVDLGEWLEKQFKYRPLIIKYGAAIKQIATSIEGREDEYSTILVAYEGEKYDYRDYIGDLEAKKIKEMMGNFKRGRAITKITDSSVAIAFKEASDAVMAKMVYDGNLNLKMFDIATLKEIP